MENRNWKDSAKRVISNTVPIVTGSLFVFYFGKLIAILDEQGQMTWRDLNYPIFLIDYLVQNPEPQSKWN